jgi:translocation and assembly module TamA
LKLSSEASSELQKAGITYELPAFRHVDQVLRLSLEFANETPDAYDSTYIGAALEIERKIAEVWTAGAGVRLRLAQENQLDLEETYHLISFPLFATRDTTDNELNATKGSKLALRLEPFFGVSDSSSAFLKWDLTGSRYYTLYDEGKWVFAVRARIASILGASLDDIPPDERLYAGGGGSIRGYKFMTVGPLVGNDPTGGRSLVETSVELRRSLTEKLSVAAFIDGGTAYASTFPKFDDDIRWGAGVGMRYSTPAGPLRVDIAVPLDRRDGIDDSLGVYVGFGQAF